MKRNIALLLTIFLVFPFVYSITSFTIQETEKISLVPNATDPDADRLIITYSPPLNKNGEWQTTYGDAGEYKSSVTISDGISADSKEVLIVVKKKEEQPKIESFFPKQDILSIKELESLDFRILASDLNKDALSYEWFLDDEKIKEGEGFSYGTTYKDAGSHKIHVTVSDGASILSKEWNVNVANVDVERLISDIGDINVNEGDTVRISLPDFEKYGLTHSISEPVGNKNKWTTAYSDAGTYEISIHAEGKGFSGDKTVKVVVNDVDRAPLVDKIENKVVNENEELKITLSARDPDGDEISYAADNLPEGASFEGNVFSWKPGYDTVKKEDFVDRVMDKFRILSRSFYVQFSASSRDKKIVQNAIITVRDVNRPPVLEDMEPITINEGAALRLAVKSYDLDGDKISLSYSGFMSTDTFKSGFDDAGTYYTRVTASDGLLEVSKLVQINILQINRAPIFSKIQGIRAGEGDNIAVLLNALDPDGDEVTFFVDNPPQGSSLKGNSFFWTLPFDAAGKKETKKFDLVFVASDGKAESRQIVKAEIRDKNRAPKIIDATKSVVARVNEPVIMFVKASDEDGDALEYTWDFGLLEKYKATAIHQRTFTSGGTKIVKVAVSDGMDEVEQIISVNVI